MAFSHQKTPVLARGVISVILCLAILIQRRLVTDGRKTTSAAHTALA